MTSGEDASPASVASPVQIRRRARRSFVSFLRVETS